MSEPSPIHDKLLTLVRNGTDATVRQLAVLGECLEKPQTVRDLAEKLNVAKPAITRAADRLEEWEFLARKKDPDDRRSVFLELTRKGRRFIEAFHAAP